MIILPTVQNAKRNATRYRDKKELLAALYIITPELNILLKAEWYMSHRADGAAPLYCNVWVELDKHGNTTSGSDFASGYGYDKKGSAFSRALVSAGLELTEQHKNVLFGGGDINGICKELARVLGHDNVLILDV